MDVLETGRYGERREGEDDTTMLADETIMMITVRGCHDLIQPNGAMASNEPSTHFPSLYQDLKTFRSLAGLVPPHLRRCPSHFCVTVTAGVSKLQNRSADSCARRGYLSIESSLYSVDSGVENKFEEGKSDGAECQEDPPSLAPCEGLRFRQIVERVSEQATNRGNSTWYMMQRTYLVA